MQFGITMEVDHTAARNARALQEFSNLLRDSFSTKSYGTGMLHFIVGFVCIPSAPGYEAWYKERRARFQATAKVRMPDGSQIEMRNLYSYDIKFSDEECLEFASASAQGAVDMFAQRLLASLSHFDERRGGFRDFATSEFLHDFHRLTGEALAALRADTERLA